MAGNVVKMAEVDGVSYPWASQASRMFAEALDRADREQGLSNRQVAARLGYKSSVVLSHMASGRAPIPIERVPDYARVLRMQLGDFLLAVLEQRYRDINWKQELFEKRGFGKHKPTKGAPDEENLVLDDLQSAAGSKLADLNSDHFNVLREAAADANAQRRWASVPELGLLDILRKERPDLAKSGLGIKERQTLKEVLAAL